MRLQLITRGSRFDLYAIDLSDSPNRVECPLIDFLEDLGKSTPSAYKSIVAVLQLHADHGPVLNERKSRIVSKQSRIFEFKNRQGSRVLYFYPIGFSRATVLTHGFNKGANLKQEIARAEHLQSQYYRGVQDGGIK